MVLGRQFGKLLNGCTQPCGSFCMVRGYRSEVGSVRVRFAPSPTGPMHLGGLRTALYNYLFAKSQKGMFVLRIEGTVCVSRLLGCRPTICGIPDTDLSRCDSSWADAIDRTLQHFLIPPDESPKKPNAQFGPYVQSQRCFCSVERLRMKQMENFRKSQVLKYDGRCRNIDVEESRERADNGEPHAIRFRLREFGEEKSEKAAFIDHVYGEVRCDLGKYEGDFVIIKTDGFPTYHLANVVDDHEMNISDVLRGNEWLMSTFKHLQIYDAMEWCRPKFHHLPLLLSVESNKKLSKRDPTNNVANYIENGYRPMAILNFLTQNGMGLRDHDADQLYSLDEMTEMFDADLLKKASVKFDKAMLKHYAVTSMNFEHVDVLKAELERLFKKRNRQQEEEQRTFLTNQPKWKEELSEGEVRGVRDYAAADGRVACLSDLADDDLAFLWRRLPANAVANQWAELVLEKRKITVTAEDFLRFLRLPLETEERKFAAALSELVKSNGEVVYKVIRLALVGETSGVPVMDAMRLLGREEAAIRLQAAIDFLQGKEGDELNNNEQENRVDWKSNVAAA